MCTTYYWYLLILSASFNSFGHISLTFNHFYVKCYRDYFAYIEQVWTEVSVLSVELFNKLLNNNNNKKNKFLAAKILLFCYSLLPIDVKIKISHIGNSEKENSQLWNKNAIEKMLSHGALFFAWVRLSFHSPAFDFRKEEKVRHATFRFTNFWSKIGFMLLIPLVDIPFPRNRNKRVRLENEKWIKRSEQKCSILVWKWKWALAKS